MSYLAFELDALNVVPDVAAAAGITPGDVAHGLLKLWAWCFREEAEVVSAVHLAGFFGRDVGQALEAFGFLESHPEGWRVRGAQRYLRIKEQRRNAGKARSLSAGRSAGKYTSEKPARNQRRASGQPAADQPSHRAPSTEVEKKGEGLRPSDLLVADFKAATGTDYLWQGAKDGVALAALLEAVPLDEVRARWRRGLKAPADEWKSCRTVAQLRAKWNDLAGEAPQHVPFEHRPGRVL